MKKWEYREIKSRYMSLFDDAEKFAWLNRNGASGWELIELKYTSSFRSRRGGYWYGLFKREVRSGKARRA